mmetsp:Transcript_31548/g.52715  ORF Transcript_31548/g.52715 Transcript_31548/m.52715 type:complete len:292 (+) Transcript_31548:56-931(+)
MPLLWEWRMALLTLLPAILSVVAGVSKSYSDVKASLESSDHDFGELRRKVAGCLERNGISGGYSDDSIHRGRVWSADECSIAEYTFLLKSINATLWSSSNGDTDTLTTGERVSPIDAVQSSALYSAIFEQYILKQRPFKSKFSQGAPATGISNSEASFASTNSSNGADWTSSKDKRDDFQQWKAHLTIPKYASNNYLRKYRVEEQHYRYSHPQSGSRQGSGSSQGSGMGLGYFDHWPRRVVVPKEGASAAEQCPSNMHMLVWPLPPPPPPPPPPWFCWRLCGWLRVYSQTI